MGYPKSATSHIATMEGLEKIARAHPNLEIDIRHGSMHYWTAEGPNVPTDHPQADGLHEAHRTAEGITRKARVLGLKKVELGEEGIPATRPEPNPRYDGTDAHQRLMELFQPPAIGA